MNSEQCPCCQHDVAPGAKFCGACGACLESVSCPACNTPNAPGHKYCHECGRLLADASSSAPLVDPERFAFRLLPEATLTSRSALEGERKQVTVLFADLKGSMELVSERDPEEARKILDPVLRFMMESVDRYEGTISQVNGDGIMALFGAPFAQEDHGIRACYCALKMQEAVKNYALEAQRTFGLPIQIRVGLNSGDVVVYTIGDDRRMGYTAVGESVHLAARMEQAAIPGSILITRATLRLAEGYVQARALGPIQVKGRAEAVEAFEVIDASAAYGRLQAAASRGLTSFVGRSNELAELQKAWQLAAEGHGQVMAVFGDAGVGKSRLLYEFARSGLGSSRLILESGPVSFGKGASYLPVVGLLRAYFRIHDRDDHRVIRENVIGKLVALDANLASSATPILVLLDVPHGDAAWDRLDPQQRREKTLDVVVRLLICESHVQPLLVVFEDLHWIDGETQEVLNSLVESLPEARILLLVNYRPEYRHHWEAKPYYSQLRIDPLRRNRAEDLLDILLGEDAALRPLKQILIERTGGNPFFLEESVRTYAELGALVGTLGAYRPTRAVTQIRAPSTVQSLIAARIDRLSAANKRLLQAAAIVGTSMPFPLLRAIADLPDEALRQGLGHLQSAGFLYETGLFPELEYTFVHALTHEVAYESVLLERRRGLHLSVMESIEQLYADRLAEHIDRLAYHAVQGEAWPKAVTYCYQAGARAAAKSAHREATARFAEALDAIGRLPQSTALLEQAVDVRFGLRTSLSPLGEFRRSFELLHEAEEIAKSLNDRARLARIFTFKALYFWSIGDQDRTMDATSRAVEAAAAIDDTPAKVLANLFAGRALHARGQYSDAIAQFEVVINTMDANRADLLGMANLPSVSARAWLSWSLAEQGEFEPAITSGMEAASIAETFDNLVSRIYGRMALGIAYLRRGDFDSALFNLESAFQLSAGRNLRMARAMVAGYLGQAYTLTNRATEAVAVLSEAIHDAASMDLMVDQAMRLAHLSEALLYAGELDRAVETAELAVRTGSDYKQHAAVAWATWILGEIHARAGRAEMAGPQWHKALALASELEMEPLRAHCHFSIGRASLTGLKDGEAEQHLAQAERIYEELEMQFWIGKAEAYSRSR
jgi:class 3 adenylate cyclase/tetratricopeptide (TPR) repeat protein